MKRWITAAFSNFLLAGLLVASPAWAAEDDASSPGVEVRAESGTWPAGEPIEDGILPIRVRIENHGEQALKLRFEDLALVGYSGDRYTALPLHDVLLTGQMPGEGEGGKITIPVPKFGHLSFRIAPSYSEVFPNSEAFPGHFRENRENTEPRREQWNPDLRPTLQMFEHLLPEGVLDAGGYVEGFLYFQEVDGWERGLRLEMAVTAAEDDQVLATVNVPVTDIGE